jgi:mono/diheme cytochrome c family protein
LNIQSSLLSRAGLQVITGLVLFVVAARAEPTFFQARVAPIFDKHCVACHGAEKKKAGLRLDSFELAMKGGEGGVVIKAGDTKGSELFRRITLPESDDEVMPSDGKPHLSAAEIKLIEFWIARGASGEKVVADYADAPKPPPPKQAVLALAPDWRPRTKEIAALEKVLGVRLTPRSQTSTDGLVLRTASAPGRCDDAALAKLAPLAELIVDAELARTKVTDAGLKSLATFRNLRTLDLTRTAVTSSGVATLTELKFLEALNLTGTAIDDSGVAKLKAMPALKRIWLFGTKATEPSDEPEKVVTR